MRTKPRELTTEDDMYRLTERRLAKARPILDKYLERLETTGRFDAHELETELRDCWGVGYQSLKGIIRDLAKWERYRYVAAYYMEHSNDGVGVVSEFKPALASMYGASSYDFDPDIGKKREAFWNAMKAT